MIVSCSYCCCSWYFVVVLLKAISPFFLSCWLWNNMKIHMYIYSCNHQSIHSIHPSILSHPFTTQLMTERLTDWISFNFFIIWVLVHNFCCSNYIQIVYNIFFLYIFLMFHINILHWYLWCGGFCVTPICGLIAWFLFDGLKDWLTDCQSVIHSGCLVCLDGCLLRCCWWRWWLQWRQWWCYWWWRWRQHQTTMMVIWWRWL